MSDDGLRHVIMMTDATVRSPEQAGPEERGFGPRVRCSSRTQLMIGLFRCARFLAVRTAWMRVLIMGFWSWSTHLGGVHSGTPSVLIWQVQPRARKL